MVVLGGAGFALKPVEFLEDPVAPSRLGARVSLDPVSFTPLALDVALLVGVRVLAAPLCLSLLEVWAQELMGCHVSQVCSPGGREGFCIGTMLAATQFLASRCAQARSLGQRADLIEADLSGVRALLRKAG